MPLRPYQEKLVNDIRREFRHGAKGVMAQLPTGAGKTFTALTIAATAAANRATTLVVVHRDELLHQWRSEADRLTLPVGLTAATLGRQTVNPDALVQIAMIDTLNRRSTAFANHSFDLVFFDEAHLGSSTKYNKLRDRWSNAKYIGLTATPSRLDGAGFPWCTAIVRGPTYEQLERHGSLVPFQTYSIDKLNYSGLRKRFGDYTASSQESQFLTQPLIGSIVDEYIDKAMGRTGLVFATTVAHSKALAASFNASGIPAEHIDGTTPTALRDKALQMLADKRLWIVCNVGVLIEGLNIPSISYIGCAFATASLSKWIQCAGRALRPAPNKTDAIICDHGGNALRHGTVDYDHQWTIAPVVKKRAKEAVVMTRLCKVCAAVYPPTMPICPVCQTVHVPEERILKHKKGKLSKLDRKQAPTRRKRRPTARQMEDHVLEWVSTFR